jgi:hypothetical protein
MRAPKRVTKKNMADIPCVLQLQACFGIDDPVPVVDNRYSAEDAKWEELGRVVAVDETYENQRYQVHCSTAF